MNIGIVLAGGMNKGFYQIGCLKAISEYFSKEDISCVTGSSIGVLTGYSFVTGQMDNTVKYLKEVDIQKVGTFFPSLSGNAMLMKKIRNFVIEDHSKICHTYGTVWNFSERKAEYIPFHKLQKSAVQDYLCASVAIPFFNKGIKIKKSVYFDGAFLDNIPVYPMLEKNIDLIFCIYFDEKNYFFENQNFDRKIIKLNDFPTCKLRDSFIFDPKKLDDMISYGYSYTKNILDTLLVDTVDENIYERIRIRNSQSKDKKTNRLTCDVVLTNLNKMANKFAKRKIL